MFLRTMSLLPTLRATKTVHRSEAPKYLFYECYLPIANFIVEPRGRMAMTMMVRPSKGDQLRNESDHESLPSTDLDATMGM